MRRILTLLLATVALPAHAEDVMSAVRGDRWAAADAAAEGYADPVVAKLVTYYRLLSPGGGRLGEVVAFLDANPDWPQRATLLRRRDEAMLLEPDDVAVARACDATTPTDARALERCAEAYGQLGRATEATAVARKGWVASAPDSVRDTRVLARWPGLVGAAEQRARFAELVWADTPGAIRQLPALAPDDRHAAEALLALRRDDSRAASMLAGLPKADRTTPEMVLETARWLRRANRDADAAELWATAGAAAEQAAPPEHLTAFWDERNILLRRRLKDGDPAAAYALADQTRQVAPEAVADSEFMAGWVALRRLSDPARALPHFRRLASSRAAITRSRAEYWVGRTLVAAGDAAGGRAAFSEAALFPNTFYGQLAAQALGGDPVAARIRDRADPAWTAGQALAFAAREPARAAATLVGWNEPRRAVGFLLRLTELGDEPADLALTGRLAQGFAIPEAAVAVARRAGRAGVVLLGTGWPAAIEVPQDTPVEVALVLAISRQESSFDAATVSPVGARGLMQLMPGTAAAEARALNLQLGTMALQSDPVVNVRLGSTYLRGLLNRYSGCVPLAVAAYNAGPSRVDGWIAANGDPRSGADPIDWIELVGFGETRNYVQRVVENVVVYRALLNQPGPDPLRPSPGPA